MYDFLLVSCRVALDVCGVVVELSAFKVDRTEPLYIRSIECYADDRIAFSTDLMKSTPYDVKVLGPT